MLKWGKHSSWYYGHGMSAKMDIEVQTYACNMKHSIVHIFSCIQREKGSQNSREEIRSEIFVLLDLCVRGSEALPADRRTSWVRAIAAARLRILLQSLQAPCNSNSSKICPEATRFPERTQLSIKYRFNDWFGIKRKPFFVTYT